MYGLLILLIILICNQQISAYSIHDENPYESQSLIFNDDDDSGDRLSMLTRSDSLFYKPINDEISLSNRWPKQFSSSYIREGPRISLRNGVIRVFPYKKRTIPLELQKALYAHGIVGRRR